MNGKTIKKIRKELNSQQKKIVIEIFDYFNSLSFLERVKIAVKIIRKKL
jgi:hypothetical protein